MTTNFRINGTDTDDLFVRKDLFTEGGLWLWGRNDDGRLGDNTITHRSSPVQTISGGTNWKQVSCGESHTAAIKTDGTLWLWGFNSYGQLSNNTGSKSSPIQVITGGTNWKQVDCGEYGHTSAVKSDGTLWLWGRNDYGQLGNGTTATSTASPVQTVSGGTNWKQVSASAWSTAAIKTDGTLWLWGYNSQGQLGTNDIIHRSSPVQTVSGGTNWKQVATGYYTTAAIKTDGTLWTWGFGGNYILGNGQNTNRSSPVQTSGGGTNWKQISCGTNHMSAIKTDGTLWTWGYNGYGELGIGGSVGEDRITPVQTISGGTNWKQVSCGQFHTAAIKTDGTLWTWGYNDYGQLGDNSITHRSSPVQTVSGGTNWKQVSTGYRFTIGIRDDYWT